MFPPEIIYTELLRHHIIRALLVLDNVVDVAVFVDGLEVSTGTFNLHAFRFAVVVHLILGPWHNPLFLLDKKHTCLISLTKITRFLCKQSD